MCATNLYKLRGNRQIWCLEYFRKLFKPLSSQVVLVVKNLPANVGDMGSISESGRSPGKANDYPLQYSCPENPMDRGAWWTTVHRVTSSQTPPSDGAHLSAESLVSLLQLLWSQVLQEPQASLDSQVPRPRPSGSLLSRDVALITQATQINSWLLPPGARMDLSASPGDTHKGPSITDLHSHTITAKAPLLTIPRQECWVQGAQRTQKQALATSLSPCLEFGWLCLLFKKAQGLPWWSSGWESALQCRRHRFDPWSGN